MLAGTDCKSVETAVFRVPHPSVPFRSRHFGEMALRIVRAYKHLGAVVHYRGCMTPELDRRCGASLAAGCANNEHVLCNKVFTQKQPLAVSEAISLSRLRYSIALWTPNTKQLRKWTGRYMSRLRSVMDMKSRTGVNLSDHQVLAKAKVPSAIEFPTAVRLRYVWRVLHHGPQCLLGLIASSLEHDRSWGSLVVQDFVWLASHVEMIDFVPYISSIVQMIMSHSRQQWKNLVNRAVRQAIKQRQSQVENGTIPPPDAVVLACYPCYR